MGNGGTERLRLWLGLCNHGCKNPGVGGIQRGCGEGLSVCFKEVLENHQTTQEQKQGLALALFSDERELLTLTGDIVSW